MILICPLRDSKLILLGEALAVVIKLTCNLPVQDFVIGMLSTACRWLLLIKGHIARVCYTAEPTL